MNTLTTTIDRVRATALASSYDPLHQVLKDALFLAEQVEALQAQVTRMLAKEGAVYQERNRLVAALSKCFPASLEEHVGEQGAAWGDAGWCWVVMITLPTGQVSWHIHDSELPQFDHLPRKTGAFWDGHTTEEKYQRLQRLQRLAPTPTPGLRRDRAIAAFERYTEQLTANAVRSVHGTLDCQDVRDIGKAIHELVEFFAPEIA